MLPVAVKVVRNRWNEEEDKELAQLKLGHVNVVKLLYVEYQDN